MAQDASNQKRIDNLEEGDDLEAWKKANYIVDRDSAYANPYYALQKLKGGNKRFIENRSIYPRQEREAIYSLAKGQTPFATIIGCSDSRVTSEILFDQGFGDLFISRTAGQVTAQSSYGTMEYAILELGTKLIVVLGHSKCGAVQAAIKLPDNPPGHVVTLINAIKDAARTAQAVEGSEEDKLEGAVRKNVVNQVNHLRDLEPVLSRKYQSGEILIVGAVYDLSLGEVVFLEETLQDLPNTSYSKENITGR
ncbi:hypothetical protein EL17_16830 [Anditalea andensis]|uniref:Carbonic anhydrase n=2 Tax=Anditalea andensis TaxID=1048983 RepID=A0A074KXS1_9BACT|nr:hypothetical protein EL17_16830 [Anditalea andensis]